MDHRLDVTTLTKGYVNLRYGDLDLGRVKLPLYDGARLLLSHSLALAGDTLTTYRNGKPSMHGEVGWCSQWDVVDAPFGIRRVKRSIKDESDAQGLEESIEDLPS